MPAQITENNTRLFELTHQETDAWSGRGLCGNFSSAGEQTLDFLVTVRFMHKRTAKKHGERSMVVRGLTEFSANEVSVIVPKESLSRKLSQTETFFSHRCGSIYRALRKLELANCLKLRIEGCDWLEL